MFSGMNQCAFVIQPALITHAQHFGGINWAHFHFIISTVQYMQHALVVGGNNSMAYTDYGLIDMGYWHEEN
jgi:hypothetical protein